jgi:hypothetical protein
MGVVEHKHITNDIVGLCPTNSSEASVYRAIFIDVLCGDY